MAESCGSARTSTRASAPSRARTSSRRRTGAWRRSPHTPRPHSLTCAPAQRGLHRGRRDLRPLAARPRGRRRARAADDRARAGRPTGTTRRPGCPRTARPSPTSTAGTCGSWRRRAARRASWSRAARPVWIGDARLIVTVERDDTTRLAVVDVDDAWPRRLAVAHGELDAHGDEGEAAVSPDGTRGRLHVHPARRPQPHGEIRVADVDGGAVRAVDGDAAHARQQPGVVARRRRDRVRVRAQRLLRAARRRRRGAPADERGRRPPRARVAPRRHAPASPSAGGATASTWSSSTRRAARPRSSPTAAPGAARTGRAAAGSPAPTRTTRRRPSCALAAAADAPRPRSARHAPRPLRGARGGRLRAPSTGWRSPPSCCRPRTPAAEHPVPAVVYPHGGPTDAYVDDWDGHAQYFVDKGYAWLAINFRGSTGYGRDYERANHGVWGVDDTQGLPGRRRLPARARLDRRRPPRPSSAPATARTWRSFASPTTPSTASAARSPSTATATSSPRGRRATARACRTSSG